MLRSVISAPRMLVSDNGNESAKEYEARNSSVIHLLCNIWYGCGIFRYHDKKRMDTRGEFARR